MEDEHLWNQIMELTPLKRWATAQEIAEWIYFVGVTNRFMTGQSLLIDGRRGRPHTIYLARIGNAPDGKPSGAFLMYRFLAEASPVDGGRAVLFE